MRVITVNSTHHWFTDRDTCLPTVTVQFILHDGTVNIIWLDFAGEVDDMSFCEELQMCYRFFGTGVGDIRVAGGTPGLKEVFDLVYSRPVVYEKDVMCYVPERPEGCEEDLPDLTTFEDLVAYEDVFKRPFDSEHSSPKFAKMVTYEDIFKLCSEFTTHHDDLIDRVYYEHMDSVNFFPRIRHETDTAIVLDLLFSRGTM